MAKVFRLYKGNDNIVDWQNSTSYGPKAIQEIEDPDAARADKQITSIPSPFARIDLIKNAFAYINRSKEIHGNTIFHKMVSDTLDVAQIFFHYKRFKDKIDIIVWDKDQKIEELLHSTNPALRAVGETLSMYMQEDDKTYGFSKMKRMYLLRYKGCKRESMMDIIGATSPCTMFFSSANDLSRIADDIQFDKDKAFDNVFASLDEREDKFIEYIYAYRLNYPNFYTDFPEVNEYLDLIYKKGLSLEQKNIVDALKETSIDDFPFLELSADYVEINGVRCRMCPDVSKISSGFEIKSEIYKGQKPLVLPVEKGGKYADIKYTNKEWGNNQEAPLKDSLPINDRILPYVGIKYPYMTIGDFLTDEIIRVQGTAFTENYDEYFFDGNIDNKEYQYLLPVKSALFDFFTPEEIQGKVSGKKMIELNTLSGGGVSVKLRIPVQNNRIIEYERTYIEGDSLLEKNGKIITKEFGIALFSNIKYSKDEDAFYRIGIISEYDENDDYALGFYKNNNAIKSELVVRNNNMKNYHKCRTYILEHSNYEYINVNVENSYNGVLIPKFIQQGGTDKYTFAIDLGTTNTHIEYKINGKSAGNLDIDEKNSIVKLWGSLLNIGKNTIDFDLFPQAIGDGHDCKYPMRTVLSEAKNTNWNLATYALGQVNIPFPYEKKFGYDYNRITTDLKWSNDKNIRQKIQMYIESLFMIMRNKVLSNYGDLAATEIVWFYPISMVQNRFNMFKEVWTRAYVKYFGGEESNIKPMTESVAPYYFYRVSQSNVGNIATIDIGGGTSDIVVANSGDVKCITSFRFAANSIFGDSYAVGTSNGIRNSLVSDYADDIKKILEDNQLRDLAQIMEEHEEGGNSANVASFFFSLKNNAEVKEKNIAGNLDYNHMLQSDDEYKLIFLFFYSSIVYHLACIMKAKSLDMPRHIAFSGNGSKVISILSPSTPTLVKYTKMIFESVYGSEYPKDGLDILHEGKNPKEVTCKGGLSNPVVQDYSDVSDLKLVLKSNKNSSFISTEKYKDIDNQYIESCVKEVEQFIHFVLDLNDKFSFKNNFGVTENALNIARNECFRDLLIYAKNGLESKKLEVSDNDEVEETMFFYPLNGMLNALATAISNSLK